jgi:hypothetical protein
MGKTAKEKRSAGEPSSGASDHADDSAPGAGARTAAEPVEPLERARLQAEVARQRVRIAKEELKRARKRMKEAKREAKRARKQAVTARKAWKKARKAHRADTDPEASGGTAGPRGEAKARRLERSERPTRGRRTHGRRTARKSQAGGNGPVTQSPET